MTYLLSCVSVNSIPINKFSFYTNWPFPIYADLGIEC